MLIHPHIASQLAAQRQREMLAQASDHRLRRQLRAHRARFRAADDGARPQRSWRARARAVLRIRLSRPAIGRPASLSRREPAQRPAARPAHRITTADGTGETNVTTLGCSPDLGPAVRRGRRAGAGARLAGHRPARRPGPQLP
jgi:hypothetical protein